MFMPDATGDAVRLFTEFQRASAPANNVVAMLEALMRYDVREEAPRVTVPTLVIHRRGDLAVPFESGREFATLIPGARFVSLEGRNHVPMPEEPETGQLLDALERFLLPDTKSTATPSGMASGLVTILFTDMQDSTAITRRLGDAKAQELLRAHNTVIREALAAHGGSETKHTGDGIMASFGSAARALECAVAIQRAFADQESAPGGQGISPENSEDGIRVRIGLNAGEPVAEEGDLFGATVQLAARVCAKAEAGQIVVSNVVRELAMGKGFLFADLGDFIPKGFEDPVRLYEVRWRN
jgi:class 3 adenylate cyclase